MFLLKNDSNVFSNCDTFLVVPSTINDSVKSVLFYYCWNKYNKFVFKGSI
jgi:hypothetical protein